jgi:hypothetical protein
MDELIMFFNFLVDEGIMEEGYNPEIIVNNFKKIMEVENEKML